MSNIFDSHYVKFPRHQGHWFLELREGGASYARKDRNIFRDTAGVIAFGDNYYVVSTDWLKGILWSLRGHFRESEQTVKSVHIGMLTRPELPTKDSPRYEASYHGLQQIKGTFVPKPTFEQLIKRRRRDILERFLLERLAKAQGEVTAMC